MVQRRYALVHCAVSSTSYPHRLDDRYIVQPFALQFLSLRIHPQRQGLSRTGAAIRRASGSLGTLEGSISTAPDSGNSNLYNYIVLPLFDGTVHERVDVLISSLAPSFLARSLTDNMCT
jgi:hypothetical protein